MGSNMRTRIGLGIIWGLALAVSTGPVQADMDEDFAFASALVNFTPAFPDLAQRVVDGILMRDPGQQDRSKIIQAEIAISRRQFAEAEALINEMGMDNPKAQAISLSLGRNLFAIGEIDKARGLYEAFFKIYGDQLPTDPDVALRYRDAAYQFAQMQEMIADFAGAAESYRRVEQVVGQGDLRRAILIARVEALIKAAEKKSGDERNKLLDEATRLCEEVQWGGLDLPFVDSIVALANIELVRGRPEEARRVLMSNMDIIRPIDDAMVEMGLPMRESPMAGTRSLLGRLLKEEADKLAAQNKADEAVAAYSGALLEYYNVFIKYGDSQWGPTAGLVSKEIKDILETKYGKTVKIDLPDTLAARAAGTEFMMADNLFRQRKYGESAAEYLRVLEQFPESGDLSIGALGNLIQAYLHLEDHLMAKVMAHYLGERFAGKSDIPARALAAAGKLYEDAGNPQMGYYMYDLYLTYCPKDSRAGQVLFYLAMKAEEAGNREQADAYYARILTDYQHDQNYPRALSRRAWRAYQDRDYEGTIEGMRLYIEESKTQPSPTLAQAMFALGDSYRRTGDLPNAVRQFDALVRAISPEGNPYGRSAEDVKRNQVLLEQARFYLGFSLSRLPAENTRRAAIARLNEFVELYPKSTLAPKALNLVGSLQMALRDPAANETFARLARDFPETDEGKNAQYARISGALELGQLDQAREALGAMLSSPGSYSVDEFARVGQAMLEHELWTETVQAFSQLMGKTEERALLERALYGIGAARYELGEYAAAAESLNDLMTRWPQSGLFYPAKFKIASASLKLNDLPAAKTALNDVLRFARDPELMNDASLLYAEVHKAENDLTAALAAYKRLEYFSSQNMKTETERRQIQQAILSSIQLANEMQRPAEVLESAERFLQLFPTSPRVGDIRRARDVAQLQLAAEVASTESVTP